MSDSVNAIYPDTIVQACVVHLIPNTFWYSSKRYRDELARDVKAIYTAANADAAWVEFEALDEKWGNKSPAIGANWRNA